MGLIFLSSFKMKLKINFMSESRSVNKFIRKNLIYLFFKRFVKNAKKIDLLRKIKMQQS